MGILTVMRLRTFFNLASIAQREQLAKEANTTIGYLQKLCYTERCSDVMALRIWQASKKVSEGDKNLQPVPGESLAKDRKQYQQLLKQIGVAA